MNRTSTSLVCLVTLGILAVTSCVTDNGNSSNGSDSTRVTFTADIDGTVHPDTRTTNGGKSWKDGDEVGIYMLTYGGTIAKNIAKGASNVLYNVADTGTGALVPGIDSKPIEYPEYWEGSVDFIAYYPYSLTKVNAEGVYTVSLTDQSDPAAIDVMTAKAPNTSTLYIAPVKLNFSHALSKVTLNIKAGTGITEAEIEAIESVLLSSTPGSAAIDLNSGTATPGVAADIAMLKTTPTVAGYQTAFMAIVANNNSTNRTITVKLGDKTVVWRIPNKDSFMPGKHNIYRGEISRGMFAVEESTIVDWIDDDHEEPLEKRDHKFNDILTWDEATGRYAMIKEPNDAGLYFTFGSVVGIFSGKDGKVQKLPAVDQYEENAVFDAATDVAWDPTGTVTGTGKTGLNSVPKYGGAKDFALVPNTITPPLYHNAANVKAGKGDPCRLVGLDLDKIKNAVDANELTDDDIDNHTWRLPTPDENKSFSDRESNGKYTYHWVAIDGIKGGIFPDKNTGSLATFLPAAGGRISYYEGRVSEQNSTGYYWSNAPRAGTSFTGSVYVLSFGQDYVSPSFPGNFSDGYSVRCVRQ